ncbi:MAG: NUDIX hydrolase [Candidatus Nanopelagicales bacterium]|jgi:8-oxo-dGTP diphosphatase
MTSSAAAPGSGDGWVKLADGRVFWGRFGAAGVLLRHLDTEGSQWFLLARRASWVHRGNGEWSVPGGAIDSHEDPITAALREFDEEIGTVPTGFRLVGVIEDAVAPGHWSYHTCCADVSDRPHYDATLSPENDDAQWWRREDLDTLPLFAPFAAQLPLLLELFDSN